MNGHGQQRRKRQATIDDVALLAGVGKSTVGRAISGRGYVSAAVRARVMRAAEEVGYVPNLAARQLKAVDSGIVGVLLADLRNTFYAEVASGVEEVLAVSEYYMVLATDHHRADREDLAVRTFTSMKAGGVILTPSQKRGDVARQLAARDVAVVEIDDRTIDAARSATVLVDGRAGVRDAVAHLVEAGHRRIAAVLWDVELQAGADRRAGYLEGLSTAGIAVDDRIVRAVPDGTEAARNATLDLLKSGVGFTAIVATNELVCLGVMEALWDVGARVPEQVSVVGFDDVPWMRTTTPPITTVAQPTIEIGRFVATALISILEGGGPDEAVTRLAPALVARSSVATVGPVEDKRRGRARPPSRTKH